MYTLQADINKDVDTISGIPIVSNLLESICRTTGMGFAAIARVTDSQWVACAIHDEIQFGLKAGEELTLETTLCNEVRQQLKEVVIDNVTEDAIYVNHLTPAMYGFKSYISVPIYTRRGVFFGTLCAIDPMPASVKNTETISMFKLFAELIAFHLDAAADLSSSEKSLAEERETAELREQFIAILGHDLRNPVGAVANIAEMILTIPMDNATQKKMGRILQNSANRMKGLINNILDFAKGRLGGGINLNRNVNGDLENILKAVITELQMTWPERTVHSEFLLANPVNCDALRIAQVFSNLLGNAFSHGKKDMPVYVKVSSNSNEFIVSVSNGGNKIPDILKGKLFQPFFRHEIEPNQQGLGLGLFIASQIAIAHGGALNVESSEKETSFTLKIPL